MLMSQPQSLNPQSPKPKSCKPCARRPQSPMSQIRRFPPRSLPKAADKKKAPPRPATNMADDDITAADAEIEERGSFKTWRFFWFGS